MEVLYCVQSTSHVEGTLWNSYYPTPNTYIHLLLSLDIDIYTSNPIPSDSSQHKYFCIHTRPGRLAQYTPVQEIRGTIRDRAERPAERLADQCTVNPVPSRVIVLFAKSNEKVPINSNEGLLAAA